MPCWLGRLHEPCRALVQALPAWHVADQCAVQPRQAHSDGVYFSSSSFTRLQPHRLGPLGSPIMHTDVCSSCMEQRCPSGRPARLPSRSNFLYHKLAHCRQDAMLHCSRSPSVADTQQAVPRTPGCRPPASACMRQSAEHPAPHLHAHAGLRLRSARCVCLLKLDAWHAGLEQTGGSTSTSSCMKGTFCCQPCSRRYTTCRASTTSATSARCACPPCSPAQPYPFADVCRRGWAVFTKSSSGLFVPCIWHVTTPESQRHAAVLHLT